MPKSQQGRGCAGGTVGTVAGWQKSSRAARQKSSRPAQQKSSRAAQQKSIRKQNVQETEHMSSIAKQQRRGLHQPNSKKAKAHMHMQYAGRESPSAGEVALHCQWLQQGQLQPSSRMDPRLCVICLPACARVVRIGLAQAACTLCQEQGAMFRFQGLKLS